MAGKEGNPPIDSEFEIAANSLNSLNPPPKDLPDLLDKLLRSDTALRDRREACDKLSLDLASRLDDLRNRLENLRRKFPEWRSDNPNCFLGPKDKHHLAFALQEAVYTRMISQVSFMHNVAHARLPVSLEKQRVECKYIFEAFLGDRHDHPGIEIANSAHLHCVDGCRWYFEHGPYEWTKKPYSNEWWAGMNQTDWDWVKMRKHVEDLIQDITSKHLRTADEFQYHIRQFVPSWLWKGDTQRWGLQTRFRIVEDQDGCKQVHGNVFISYQKSQIDMEQEHARKVAALVKQREQEDMDNPTDIDIKGVVIEPMGTFDINNFTIFDGEMLVADWEQAARVPAGSWLSHWGYDRWIGIRK